MDAGRRARGSAWPMHRGDEPAPVAALDAEAAVAQHFRHQFRIEVGDVADTEAFLAGLEGKRVAGERRRHHGEVLGEQRNELVELEHRARPAVRDQQRHRIGPAARLVDEMQIDAADRGRELAEAVELAFPRAPVEARLPIIGEALHVRQASARGPRLAGRLVRPARAREALAQLGDVGVGHVQCERFWSGRAHPRAPGACIDRRAAYSTKRSIGAQADFAAPRRRQSTGRRGCALAHASR